MTLEARRVAADPRWYRERDAALGGLVTNRAVNATMATVIERHSKTTQSREPLQRTRLSVGVTDRTDPAAAVLKLQLVTANARRVSAPAGKTHASRVVIPLVAQ